MLSDKVLPGTELEFMSYCTTCKVGLGEVTEVKSE